MKKSASLTIVLGVLSLLLAACDPRSDQTIVNNWVKDGKPVHFEIANPTPTARDFVGINKRHKILLAIFDTGIDYNHPKLRDNVHFDLDASGKPIGLGRDYWGKDNWSSYRAVDTALYPFEYRTKRNQEQLLESFGTAEKLNKHVHHAVEQKECVSKAFLEADPRLAKYFHTYRGVGEEGVATLHGTHVAGLMTYDRPEFGLISYRVLPFHRSYEDIVAESAGKEDRFVTNFKEAVAHASQRGVKIINLSLGGEFKRPDEVETPQDLADLEKYETALRIITVELKQVMRDFPHILFVAATGNQGGWSDNYARTQYPCGIESPNMVCVGATTSSGTRSNFTNIPLNGVELVFAPGSRIVSLAPSDRCQFLYDYMAKVQTESTPGGMLCKYDLTSKSWVVDSVVYDNTKAILQSLYKACSDPVTQYSKMSGTSMATPIVSRMAADIWVQNPGLKPAEVIARIRARGRPYETANHKATFLAPPYPSWYKHEAIRLYTLGAPTQATATRSAEAAAIASYFNQNPDTGSLDRAVVGAKEVLKRLGFSPIIGWKD